MRPAILGALLGAVLACAPPAGCLAAAGTSAAHYRPLISGVVSGYRLAGIEPDGDPLDQVVLQTELAPSAGLPRLHLIVDSYLENFKPDTTPILPDLLHPKQTAQNLGGFLQGKVLLTDDTGTVLAIGSFLAEAFIGNSSNHAVMKLYGSGVGYGGKGALKGSFILHHDATLAGALSGFLSLPASAYRRLARQSGPPVHVFGQKLLKSIISTVSVQPAPMMGKATTGSSGAPLHTGFGTPKSSGAAPSQGGAPAEPRRISTVTLLALLGAGASFLIAAALWWKGRAAPESGS